MRSSDGDGGDTGTCELLAELPTWAGSTEGVGATKAEQLGRSNDDEEPSLWPEPDEVRITERSAAAAYLAMMMCYRLLL